MNKHTLAYIISRILGPFPLICVIWLTSALKSGIGFWKAVWVYPLIFIFTIAIPVTITTYLITVKKIADIEWKNLTDRRKILLPLGIYSITCLTILTYFLTNTTTFHLTILFSTIVLATLAIYTFTNFKISGHIIVATVTIANLNLAFGLKYFWLFLLIIPIIWARHTLKVHTLTELIAGLILPGVIIIAALLLFGWPAVP